MCVRCYWFCLNICICKYLNISWCNNTSFRFHYFYFSYSVIFCRKVSLFMDVIVTRSKTISLCYDYMKHGIGNMLCTHICLMNSQAWALTHWGRVTHICVGKLTTIVSDNGLSPRRRPAIIWTIARILLIGPLGTNFSGILIGIQTFSFKKINAFENVVCEMASICLGLNVLTVWPLR